MDNDNNIIDDTISEQPIIEPVETPVSETISEPIATPIEVTPELTSDQPTPKLSYLITENTQSLALVRLSDGLVETFLRVDIPEGWRPPEGFTVVPNDQLPPDWQKAPEPSPLVPQTITATQIRLWLVNKDISLETIDNLIEQIPDSLLKSQIKVQWEYAPYVERNHPMINTLGSSLGLNDDQIDQAFREAALL